MKGLKNEFYPTKFLIVQTSVPNTKGNFSSQDLASTSNYTAKGLDSQSHCKKFNTYLSQDIETKI